MTQWTTAQSDAIHARECNLLVSAAAGSGKTAVLVERIVNKVVLEKIDIDRILVVTFTRAAAAQMKQRIGDAIEKRLAEDPENMHLQRQSALVHHAPISTIDSFCLDVVRSHIHDTDLDPDFRVADEGEIRLLEHDVFARLKESAYEEADPDFLFMIDSLEPQLREENLEEAVLRYFHFSQAYPWPAEWRRKSLKAYHIHDTEEFEQAEWVRYLVSYLREQIADAAHQLRRCQSQAPVYEPDPKKGYGPKLGAEALELERMAESDSYGKLYECTRVKPWGTLRKLKDEDPALFEQAKQIRNACKDRINKLIEKYLPLPPDKVIELMEPARRCAAALGTFTDSFENAFNNAKRDRGIVDFSDVEHMALRVLICHEEGGDRPSKAAAVYASAYDEIMIDEYQDSNEVQELLLKAVSGEWNGHTPNRFMVGDVKQSIYRFRQAMPELFMEKYGRYTEDHNSVFRKIELNANFRSRPEVLEAVNLLFSQIMRRELGGVEYDEKASLHPGASYPDLPGGRSSAAELWIVTDQQSSPNEENETGDSSASQEEGADEMPPDSDMREARITARRILSMMQTEQVWDGQTGRYRPLRYGDIAVLLRAAKGHAQAWLDAFEEAGIPAYTGGGTGYFSAPEVRAVMSYLHVLDNPRQDIPLTAVLRSPMGGFSAREIAQIRISGNGRGDLWDDLCAMKEDASLGKKVTSFLEQTSRLRRDAVLLPIHELIWRLITGTGYLDYVTAMPAGAQRRANLNMLAERAATFEQGSFRGLFHFLRYIQTLRSYEIDYGEAPLAGENADTVLIMSIHKSKGLEYPVTFVCGLGRRFNSREASGQMVLNQHLGMGLSTVDPESHIQFPSILQAALGLKSLEEARGEELRVLYVAATRAKERLILVGSGSVPGGQDEKEDEKSDLTSWYHTASTANDLRFEKTVLQGAKTPFDLIVPAALRHPDAIPFCEAYGLDAVPVSDTDYAAKSGIRLHAVSVSDQHEQLSDIEKEEQTSQSEHLFQIDKDKVYDPDTAAGYACMTQAVYGHTELENIRAKVSVSYIKEKAYEEEQERIYQLIADRAPSDGKAAEKAAAVEREANPGQLTGAERGTLYHSFMEYLQMMPHPGEAFYDEQLESMINCGKMPSDARRVLKKKDFQAFFASDVYKRMCAADAAGKLHREAPFVLGEKACDLKEEWKSEETVLVQGIIDAWFTDEDGRIVLLDYKTDFVPDRDESSLIRKYRAQLNLYARALERLTEREVKEQLIWSFGLGRTVAIPLAP